MLWRVDGLDGKGPVMAVEGGDESIGSAGVPAHDANLVGLDGAGPAPIVGQIEDLVDAPRGLDEEVGGFARGDEARDGLRRSHSHPILDADLLGRRGAPVLVKAQRSDLAAGLPGLVPLDEATDPQVHLMGMKHEGGDPMALAAVVDLAGLDHRRGLGWARLRLGLGRRWRLATKGQDKECGQKKFQVKAPRRSVDAGYHREGDGITLLGRMAGWFAQPVVGASSTGLGPPDVPLR